MSIDTIRKQRTQPAELIVFATLSSVAFISPILNSWGSFPASDLLFSLPFFLTFLIIQCVLIEVFGRLKTDVNNIKSALYVAILAGNIFYFSFVFTSDSPIIYFSTIGVYVCVFFLASRSEKGISFVAIFVLIHLLIWGYQITSTNKFGSEKKLIINDKVNAEIKNKTQRSVYIIGIDGMVSKQALLKFYGIESVGIKKLEELGFKTYDIISPGNQTLITFGSLLSYSADVHPRTVRRLFNGQKYSQLYADISKLGFKIQFFFENEYFGVDAGLIDNFSPAKPGLNFCNYVDDRWGWYFCRLYKKIVYKEEPLSADSTDRYFDFYKKNVAIGPDLNKKWFSIHHIWFPGHTINPYNGNDYQDRESFRKYYNNAQAILLRIFEKITNHILAKDPKAVIVFFGDHGSYLLSGVKSGANLREYGTIETDILNLDARSVLLAVYPHNFCNKDLSTMENSEIMFGLLARCASTYEP